MESVGEKGKGSIYRLAVECPYAQSADFLERTQKWPMAV
jgi:hypothetical protein